MKNKDRMFTGDLYLPNDAAITEEQNTCLELLYTFNQTRPSEQEKRNQLLKQMFAEIGENCYIEPPFHANFGGKHVHFGKNIYANFNLTMVDDGHIYVGDYTMFAPGVIVATAGHPILPELRETVYQYNITSGKIAGLEQVQLFCRALPLATKSSLVQAVLSQKTCRPTW